MHELAICKSIIDIVNSSAADKGFTRVLEISLRVGEYSGLVPQCIEELFPIAAGNSIAENAALNIKSIPARFKCMDCGYEGGVDKKKACCPSCQSCALRMTAGREFYVEDLKVE